MFSCPCAPAAQLLPHAGEYLQCPLRPGCGRGGSCLGKTLSRDAPRSCKAHTEVLEQLLFLLALLFASCLLVPLSGICSSKPLSCSSGRGCFRSYTHGRSGEHVVIPVLANPPGSLKVTAEWQGLGMVNFAPVLCSGVWEFLLTPNQVTATLHQAWLRTVFIHLQPGQRSLITCRHCRNILGYLSQDQIPI